MKKRTISALLALLIAASSFTALTSCNSPDTDTSPNDTTIAENTAAPVETEPEDTSPKLELPEDLDLGGRDITIAVMTTNGWVQQRDFTFSDEASGEPINDAAKERIQKTEELLNCKVVAPELGSSKELTNKVRTDVMAGGDSYDALIPGMSDIYNLGTDGLLYDLYELEHIDTTKPWWSQSVTKHLSIMGKLFFTVGDISLIDNDGIGAIGFNKKLLENYNLESPYPSIFDGTWTVDKMFTMASKVTKDLNGDGVMDANDLYGYVADPLNILFMYFGTGETLTAKDENDLPYASVNNERTIRYIDRYLSFTNTEAYAQTTLFGGHEPCNTNFMNDQMLFRYTTMYRFTQMRNMETDFGFVTIPKLDESQDSYHHSYSFSSPGLAIPVTVSDPQMIGAAIEALSYYGRELMLKAYYDVTLQGKVARDDESAEVLDIIFDTSIIDLGNLYNFGGMRDIWAGFVTSGTNSFPSTYAGISEKVDLAIESLIETVSALE
nr:hypothetical protein [Clostridia bacterium]